MADNHGFVEVGRDDRELRRRIYTISQEAIVALLRTGHRLEVVRGAPDDAQVVGVNWMPELGSFGICLRHDSFDPVEPGCLIPIHHAELRLLKPIAAGTRAITVRDMSAMLVGTE